MFCSEVDVRGADQVGRALHAMGIHNVSVPPAGTSWRDALPAIVAGIAIERGAGLDDGRDLRECLSAIHKELDDALALEITIDDTVRDCVAVPDEIRAVLPEHIIALTQAVNARALALEVAKRTGSKFVDPGIVLPGEVVEILRDLAVDHTLALVGLAAEGTPKLDEPLSRARARVGRKWKVRDDHLACRMAGVDTVQKAGGSGELFRLLDEIPSWVSAFTLSNIDRLLLSLPLRDHDLLLAAETGLEAMRAWPRLPSGACRLRPVGENP